MRRCTSSRSGRQRASVKSWVSTRSCPSLERYVDSGGDWNMYDTSKPADEAEWIKWNNACPQDVWQYEKAR